MRGWKGLVDGSVSNTSSIWWQDLCSICEGSEASNWFVSDCKWKFGSGEKVRFWHDIWLKNSPLATTFPRLYYLSSRQNANLHSMSSWTNGQWRWSMIWRRALFAWEEEKVAELFGKLPYISLDQWQDSWIWDGDLNGLYSVQSTYGTFFDVSEEGLTKDLFSKIRSLNVPSKVRCFVWHLVLNRLPYKDSLVDQPNCIFCNVDIDSADHVFFLCPCMQSIWSECYLCLGEYAVQPRSTASHFLQH